MLPVTEYGARWNGSSDDSRALALALAAARRALAADGQRPVVVQLPRGTGIGRVVVDVPGVTLRGMGPGATTLANRRAGNDHAVTVTARGCTLQDFTIDGTGSGLGRPSAGDGASCLAVSPTASGLHALRVRFRNAYNKQTVQLGSDFLYEECDWDGQATTGRNQDGLHVYGGAGTVSRGRVRSCRFARHVRAGIYCDIDVRGLEVADCQFDNTGGTAEGAAVLLQGYPDNITIRGGSMLRYKHGVRARCGVGRLVVEGTRILECFSSMILVDGADAIYGLLQRAERRFGVVRRTVAAAGAQRASLCRALVVRGVSGSFGVWNGAVVEPRAAAGITLSGFNSVRAGVFESVQVDGFEITGARQTVGRFLLFALGAGDRALAVNCDAVVIRGGVRRLVETVGGRGPEVLTFGPRSDFRGLLEPTAAVAGERLEFIGCTWAELPPALLAQRPLHPSARVVRVMDNRLSAAGEPAAELISAEAMPPGGVLYAVGNRLDDLAGTPVGLAGLPPATAADPEAGSFLWVDDHGRWRAPLRPPDTA